MTINIITIGDEILIGQVIDTNSAWMAQQLNLVGAKVSEIQTVGDSHKSITEAIGSSLKKADVVLLTGGLGPTQDDITKKAIADYFGTNMIFHEPTWKRIKEIFQRWGRSTTPAHKAQCFMPANATLLHNKMGTAPGMWFEKDRKIVISMPGVPFEMKYLMEFEVIPKLIAHFPGKPIEHRTILTVGEGESRIAARIDTFEKSLPNNINLAYLPNLGSVRLRLTAISENGESIAPILDKKVEELKKIIPELIYGYGTETLEEVVGKMLKNKGLTIATAESCTGGYLSHLITTVPGSSVYFLGGIIAYAYEVKQNQLGVKKETLEKHGAVSEETVIEMMEGVVKVLNTDIGISISGIAGPGGGMPGKPVGTVWFAIGNKEQKETLKVQLGKDRLRNIQYTAVLGLNMIRVFIKKHYPERVRQTKIIN